MLYWFPKEKSSEVKMANHWRIVSQKYRNNMSKGKGKGKGKFHTGTGHEGPEGE
jgi:hypothetical protein